ncbi:LacI family DNA-binding transcriptional regulator [Halonatronum saccharophilum]|uniref:LacI family DNA-binding transcriptional regulator n=1 Tax=Halonatronum saccharophilum TaxID=150060 RepID=UPI0004891B6E|nr:LacI family DNA-binding transcriptional regulator [Halonatronum saccharophilum]
MRLTIKDIAKLSGVSKSTVSRVINDADSVSDKAREKVEKVIKETGYVPNHLAKDLKRNKTNTIGVVLPKINTSTFSSAVEGICNVVYAKGYNLLLTNTRLDLKEEIKHLDLLKKKRVSGILFFATQVTDAHKKAFEDLKIPAVIMGQDTSGEIDLPCIIHNDFNSAKDIVNLLIDNGHKDIAYIGIEEKDIAVGKLRREGYQKALEENSLTFREEYIYRGDFSIKSGYNGMLVILERVKEVPTALFAATDRLAIGAIKALNEKGYKVPEDISVVGIGDAQMSSLITPPLTTVRYDHLKVGEIASEILLKSIKEGQLPKDKVIMDYQIIERESMQKI